MSQPTSSTPGAWLSGQRAETEPRLSDGLVASADRRREHQVNAGIVRTVLDAVAPARSVRHVALVTGLKHYLGPFEAYRAAELCRRRRCAKNSRGSTSRTSTTTRKTKFTPPPGATASPGACTGPHTIIGKAIGNAMNMGSTLAAYASICKETRPAIQVPGQRRAMERSVRHDRRAHARQAARLGEHHRRREERGLQHRQRRHLPLELDLAAHRQVVRRLLGRLRGRARSARSPDGE